MTRNRRIPRLWVRLLFFSAAVALLWPLPFSPGISKIPIQASPFVAFCFIPAEHTIQTAAIIGLVFTVIVFFRKRYFCRYVCPTGLLLDGAARIGARKVAWWKRLPSIGTYIFIVTIAGAAVGYPLLLWMDPLAVFSSAVSVRNAEGAIAGALAIILPALLFIITLILGDIWCARLCPLGAMQDLLAKAGSLVLPRNKKPSAESDNKKKKQSLSPPTRRAFLSVAAGIGFGFLARGIGRARGEMAPLRPPGSSEEEVFAGLCVRCGNCIRTCPTKIIRTDTGQAGISGLLAPVVRFEEDYCLEDCQACTSVCPSGALEELSLEQKRRYKIGEALLDGSRCFLVQGVNDCDICIRSCPFDAIEVYWDEDLYVAYPNIDPDKCNGCGACEVYCPTPDVKAIRVWKTENTIP